MEKYKYEDRLYANSLVHLISENRFIETRESKEVTEVYRKARAFDEIVAEFGHYVDTLQSWESIDHKDTQTLLEIIKENMEDN